MLKEKSKLNYTSILLCAMLLVLTLSSCGKPSSSLDDHITGVIKPHIQEYRHFIYTDFGAAKKYDIQNNTISDACTDRECDGDCPLDMSTLVKTVYDEKLFFLSFKSFSQDMYIGYQDLNSGELTVLVQTSVKDGTYDDAIFVSDGYLYYVDKLPKSTNNPRFNTCVFRVSLSDGKVETLFDIDQEKLFMVAEGIIVTYSDGILYSRDIDSEERRILYDMSNDGFTTMHSDPYYVNGRLYFLCNSAGNVYSEYRNQYFIPTFLVSVNIKTGESQLIKEDPVASFCPTDGGIYYSLYRLRHMYIPDNYKENPQSVVIFLSDENIHFCDFDGSNDCIVYTNEKMDFTGSRTVIDGVQYGWLFDYSDSEHSFGHVYFGSIDYRTGKVTKAKDCTSK